MQTEKKKSNKVVVVVAILFVALVAILGVVYLLNKPATSAGAKQVTIEIVAQDGASENKTIQTDEEYLGKALVANELVQGEQSDYGLFIKTVNGVTADDTQEQWWCITKGGEDVMTGADETPIADGDTFELTLKTGY